MPRMLFIGINYYAYIGKISAAFGRQGYDVDYREIEDVGFWSKTHKKLSPSAYRRQLDDYHRRLIDEAAATRYDLVFFLQCHHFSHDNMRRLRASQPAARFVLYNWDSLSTHDYRPWLTHFDKAVTFDPKDAADLKITYLPLFATRDFFEVDPSASKEFDLYFVGAIGTMHRFNALKKLHAFCRGHGIRTHFHLKCSPVVMAKLLFARQWLPGLSLRSIGFADIVRLIEKSRAVFDFANHAQSGYTMRFIENMCAGQKIITENSRVAAESFYSRDRFLVIDNLDFSGIPEFLATPVISELDAEAFSVDSWARGLLA
jgi:hypothetical protein